MNKDQIIHEIGSKLVKDIDGRKKGWAHLVIVANIENNDPEMTGFAYFENGEHEPYAPRDFSILRLLVDLRKAMATDDKVEPWQSALFRVDRDSEEIDAEFEYDKADRWAVTPKNVEQRAAELSPFKK